MSDFDEFMKQSEGGDKEEPSELFELEVSDKKGPKSLVEQLKKAIDYDGSDTHNEILLLSCEEFMAICQREIEIFKQTIAELKEIKRVKTEKAAGAPEIDKKALDEALKKDIN